MCNKWLLTYLLCVHQCNSDKISTDLAHSWAGSIRSYWRGALSISTNSNKTRYASDEETYVDMLVFLQQRPQRFDNPKPPSCTVISAEPYVEKPYEFVHFRRLHMDAVHNTNAHSTVIICAKIKRVNYFWYRNNATDVLAYRGVVCTT